MHKTGSSSIQETLRNYRCGGFKYAELGSSNHSVPMVTIFSENRYSYGNHLSLGRTSSEIDEFKKKSEDLLLADLNDIDVENLIISGEEISYLSYKSVIEIKNYFKNYFDKIIVLAYVRDPIGFSNSAFQEVVKGGYRGRKIPQPLYRSRFEKFIDVFGCENVHFRLFDKNNFSGESVVKDFCSWVNLPSNSLEEKRINESLPKEVVALAYLFNKKGSLSSGAPELVIARNKMFRILSRYFFGKFKLPNFLIFNEIDHGDLDWIKKISGINFEECFCINSDSDFNENFSIDEYMENCLDSSEIRSSLIFCLKDQGVKFKNEDSVIDLLNKMYYKILFSEYKKSIIGQYMENFDLPSFLRDKAIFFEDSNIILSCYLMRAAQIIKPSGSFINKKVNQYIEIIKSKRQF